MRPQTNVEPVNPGDPITAEFFNKIVDRVNNPSTEAPAPPKRSSVKGDFWLWNNTGAAFEPFRIVPLGGFARSYGSEANARTALANDEIVLKPATIEYQYRNAWTLEKIEPGGVGRAKCVQPCVFGFGSGSSLAVENGRFVNSDGGYFELLFRDSSSGLALACYVYKIGRLDNIEARIFSLDSATDYLGSQVDSLKIDVRNIYRLLRNHGIDIGDIIL